MSDTRAKGIVATSFIGGVLVAIAIFAPRAWEPIPEPFFGLEEPVPVAAPLPSQSTGPRPSAPTDETPVGDLASLAAAMPAVVKPGPPPERLALVPGDASRFGDPARRSVAQAAPPRPVGQSTASPESARQAASPPAPPPTRVSMDPPPAAPDSLRSLVTRVQMRRLTAEEPLPSAPVPPADPATAQQPARIASPAPTESLGAAPLPGAAWTDPDSVNWADAVAPSAAKPQGRGTGAGSGGRLIDRLRHGERIAVRTRRSDDPLEERLASIQQMPDVRRPGSGWPHPAKLMAELRQAALSPDGTSEHPEVTAWSEAALASLGEVLATLGPRDASSAAALIRLGEAVHAGMEAADRIGEGSASSEVRRAALAVSRRVAVWRSAAAMLADPTPEMVAAASAVKPVREPQLVARAEADVVRLLDVLERYEVSSATADAAAIRETTRMIEAVTLPGAAAVARAVADHYLAPNVRIAVHQQFVERLMPEQEVKTGPVNEVIAGRQVRGTRTVTRTTVVRFIPDHDEIAMHLEVQGDIASRSVTDAGVVSLASRGTSSFVVRKPITVSAQGLLFGPATGTASNSSQLAGIQTSFDSVPVMRSFVRQIARSQHDGSLPDVNREVINKIVAQACRETDEQAEPKFVEVAERVRTKAWAPLASLGLEPTPVSLESTSSVATMRLRLAAGGQIAAHTPRPRAPTDTQMSMQLHESAVNNAIERMELAGERFSLESLARHVCERLGSEPRVPDDLPEGVEVTFAATDPIRVTCHDGLIQVRVALEAIESGRRNWYDVVVQVAYRPAIAGPQVFLERDGPVRISGPGHQGRMEIALRTIFSKIFPKERPIPVVPERIVRHPRLDGMRAVQAVSQDGWFALALATREPPATVAAPQPATQEARRPTIFR
jgi:hypothetical protein